MQNVQQAVPVAKDDLLGRVAILLGGTVIAVTVDQTRRRLGTGQRAVQKAVRRTQDATGFIHLDRGVLRQRIVPCDDNLR